MDFGHFSSKVAEEYPVLLVAEVLVIITIGIVATLGQRLTRLIGVRYIGVYRSRRIRYLQNQLNYFERVLTDDNLHSRKLVIQGIKAVIIDASQFNVCSSRHLWQHEKGVCL